MKEKIIQCLSELEQEKEIQILLACETGSRAWGFPSTDSDYDIRIIYKHHKDWYLSLTEEKDTIDLMLDNNNLDISGWELRKSLRLLWKSNPPLLERIQSPVIYMVNQEFLNGINEVAQQTYSRIATIQHYLSMSKKFYDEIANKPEFKLKKFFYALRTAIACLWILEREDIPPIEFRKMINGLDLSPALIQRIDELIALKATISETYFHKEEAQLIQFMKECISRAENESKSLPGANGKMENLNNFFRKVLSE